MDELLEALRPIFFRVYPTVAPETGEKVLEEIASVIVSFHSSCFVLSECDKAEMRKDVCKVFHRYHLHANTTAIKELLAAAGL